MAAPKEETDTPFCPHLGILKVNPAVKAKEVSFRNYNLSLVITR